VIGIGYVPGTNKTNTSAMQNRTVSFSFAAAQRRATTVHQWIHLHAPVVRGYAGKKANASGLAGFVVCTVSKLKHLHPAVWNRLPGTPVADAWLLYAQGLGKIADPTFNSDCAVE
jgi:hypothetical protein